MTTAETGATGLAETGTGRPAAAAPRDRSLAALLWYRIVQHVATAIWLVRGGIRSSGTEHIPPEGGVLIVSNHLSHLDVFLLGLTVRRPLNYVARSSLFKPVLGPLIRSVGGFSIQRDGRGAAGLKETLKRLKGGGAVILFPEGTRSLDGEMGPFKAGIGLLAGRARVPIVPAAVAGSYEAWPRGQAIPSSHPVHVHYGAPFAPEQFEGLGPEAVTELLRNRILDCQQVAREQLARRQSG